LKQITIDVTGKLTKNRSGLSLGKGLLQRHTPGAALTEAQLAKLGVVGATLDMTRGVELRAHIDDDTIEDNQDNKNFDQEQYDTFGQGFSNDLAYLAFVGTADNAAAGAPFNELSKGFLTVAAESTLSSKATSAIVANDRGQTIENALYKVIDSMHEDAVDASTIYMNPTDYRNYVRRIAKDYKALALLKKGDLLTIENVPLSPQSGIPSGTYLATPPKNMVMGLSSRVKRVRWWENDISSLCYKFIVYPDFEFDIEKWVTLVTEV
ncbi:MAG: hypothetical protein DRI37_06345, partial [Chloroflexi bacterium]